MRWLIPPRWRQSVLQDLADEQARLGRSARWRTWHIARIGIRLRAAEFRKHAAADSRTLLRGWRTDIFLAWRSSRRQLASTLAIVTMLALGIGAASSTFAVFNAVVFRPIPGVVAPDRLVTVMPHRVDSPQSFTGASFARFEAMRSQASALSGLAAVSNDDYRLAAAPDVPPVAVPGCEVTRDFFQILGAHARLGRLMTGRDYESPDSRVAVISESLWASFFARDASVIGKPIWIDEQRFVVIGVTDYEGSDRSSPRVLWVPYGARRALSPTDRYSDGVFQMVGRLAARATIPVAQDQLRAAFSASGALQITGATYVPGVTAGLDNPIGHAREVLIRIYTILMSGIAMLLLLACANAGNLMVARHVARRRDLSLRGAIGASRARLMRELVVEAAMLATAAGGFGLFLGWILIGAFRGQRLLPYLPKLDDVAIDWRVAVVACGAAAATLFIFALAPAWTASRVDVREALAEASRASRRGRSMRVVLVGVQIALAFTLIVGTGLMMQTVRKLRAVNVGFDPSHVVSVELHPAGSRDRAGAALTAIADRVAGAGAGPSGLLQFGPVDSLSIEQVRRPEMPVSEAVDVVAVKLEGQAMSALGVPVVAGRFFTPAEAAASIYPSGGPVVLGEATARRLFGSASAALNQRIVLAGNKSPIPLAVIGVSTDVAGYDIRIGPRPSAYMPAIAGPGRVATLVIRTSWTPVMVTDLVRRVAHDVDPTTTVPPAISVTEHLDDLLATERVLARLGAVIASLAAVLALFGIHAVVTFIVSERTREFGIRAALGATASHVLGGAVRGVLVACGVGVAGGMILTAWSSRALADRLYGVGRFDVATFAVVSFGLLTCALAAALGAGRRATRIDPAVALRAD